MSRPRWRSRQSKPVAEKPVTPAEAATAGWLHAACPRLFALLTSRAQRRPPAGLVAFLAPPDADERGEWLRLADADAAMLMAACGERRVQHAYRRALSGATSGPQIAETLCELAVCARVSRLSSSIALQPGSGHGTRVDFVAELVGARVYGEVKRYEDSWFTAPGRPVTRGRSIVKSPAGTPVPDADPPRSMELRGKLERVPWQFPDAKVNVLFVFHSSFGDSHDYLQAALFGDAAYGLAPQQIGVPGADGLFAAPAWQTVSACYYVRLDRERGLHCVRRWLNPNARMPLPSAVRELLDGLQIDSTTDFC